MWQSESTFSMANDCSIIVVNQGYRTSEYGVYPCCNGKDDDFVGCENLWMGEWIDENEKLLQGDDGNRDDGEREGDEE